jgi:hypothetical protein
MGPVFILHALTAPRPQPVSVRLTGCCILTGLPIYSKWVIASYSSTGASTHLAPRSSLLTSSSSISAQPSHPTLLHPSTLTPCRISQLHFLRSAALPPPVHVHHTVPACSLGACDLASASMDNHTTPSADPGRRHDLGHHEVRLSSLPSDRITSILSHSCLSCCHVHARRLSR